MAPYYKRPRGRARKNCVWSTSKGEWVLQKSTEEKVDKKEINVTTAVFNNDKGTPYIALYDYLDIIKLPEDLEKVNVDDLYDEYLKQGGVAEKSEFRSTAESYLNLPSSITFDDTYQDV